MEQTTNKIRAAFALTNYIKPMTNKSNICYNLNSFKNKQFNLTKLTFSQKLSKKNASNKTYFETENIFYSESGYLIKHFAKLNASNKTIV